MATTDMLFGFMPTFFHSQLFVTPPYPTQSCKDKTIIVTGANVGLGKEAARHYVRLGASKVILACRSVAKGEEAANDIQNSTKRAGVVEVWQLDLGDYQSVKQFAQRAQGLSRLDSAVLNAGIHTTKFTMLEGNESTITVNVVSTFLLALLLLPTLQATAKQYSITPTLTVVSSELHAVTLLPERNSNSIFGNLNNKEKPDMKQRYEKSKLLEVLACRQIVKERPADRLHVTLNFVSKSSPKPDCQIIQRAYCPLDPGWCHSALMREMNNPVIRLIQKLMCRTTEVGSRTLVHAGLAGPETHGKYLSDCKITKCAPLVEGKAGPELERRVWSELATILNGIEPGVTDLLGKKP